MSPIAAGLDGLLALLLVLALALGLKLNARLKTLRESQAGFAAAVAELNAAAARAEAGLAALKTASEGAHDDLLARIDTARSLVQRLERASGEAERTLASPGEPSVRPARPGIGCGVGLGGAMAAIAALAETRPPERDWTAAGEGRTSPPRRAAPRPGSDDDLFETRPPPRDADLGPLRSPRGDPR